MDASPLRLEMLEADIAAIVLDAPDKSVNILASRVLDEFERQLDLLEKRTDLAGLVIASGKPGTFVAGADLREFVAWIDAPKEEVTSFCRRGQQLFGRLAQAPFVTVAAIDGVCLGGGAELAMWCDRRVLSNSPKTQYGFPEVQLGLFPGWGGTARTPRMIGLGNAVELVTGGEPLDAQAAYRIGIANDLVSDAKLTAAAIAMIRAEKKSGDYLRDRQAWAAPIEMSETELVFLGATAQAFIQQKTEGHYPAPLAALELMLEAAAVDLETACRREAQAFTGVFGSPVNRALLNVFFLRDANKKDPGVDKPVEPRPIRSVGVYGAGIMGQGIAAANVKRKIPVTISDSAPASLQSGVSKILEEVSYSKERKGPDPQKAIELAPLVRGTLVPAEAAGADLVIEAIIENADAKQQLYAAIAPQLGDQSILASNTSTIPITQLAQGLARPDRFVGIHFFNPVRKMPLVEVIRGRETSDHTVATAVAYAKAIGKSPIVVRDGPGFLVNRILLPYMTESVELILEGAAIRHVEKAALSFGMPMGPLTLFDVVGIDTAVHAGRVMYAAFPDRVITSELLVALFKSGRLGQKSGSGFFSYQNKKGRGEPDPAVEAMIAERRRGEGKFTPEELQHRLFLPMLLEATRILAEGIVRDPRDVDLGLIFGIGFPPFRGGLLYWADTLGAARIVELLKPLAALGKRYEPTPLLVEMAKEKRKFYAEPSA